MIGAIGVLALVVAPLPAGAADSGRVLPPGSVSPPGVSAFATPDSPYVITSLSCGNAKSVKVPARFVTLIGIGGDGGDNAQGVKGGAGGLAVASYDLPVGAPLEAAPGCRGTSSPADAHPRTQGGVTPGHARGGNGGLGLYDGQSGGAGGGYSGWFLFGTPLAEAGGGGGAGALVGGGAGGDADRPGSDALPFSGVCCSRGGGAGTFAAQGGGGDSGGFPGLRHSGGRGSDGLIASPGGIGGGGGGSGRNGGGGGGGGFTFSESSGAQAAGGGGGGSGVGTTAGFWASAGGSGHGTQAQGRALMARTRAVARTTRFPGQDVIRGVAGNGTHGGGYTVDRTGIIRTFSQGVEPPVAHDGVTWPGQDMARGIAVLPDGSGGYVVDKFGALHPFSTSGAPPSVTTRSIWPGRDMARGVTILPDGSGGYVLGRNGSMIPFAIGGGPKPKAATNVPGWPGYDITRGVTAPFLDASGNAGGYIVDLLGRLHPWGKVLGGSTRPAVGPNPAGARGVVSFAGGAGGLIVDGTGTLSAFASPGLP